MGELKSKQLKADEMLLSCSGVQTAGGRVQVHWEADSAATPMGQLAYFIEFLTLTGLWSGSIEAQALMSTDARTLGSRIPAPDMIISAYPFCSTGQQWDNELYRTCGKRVPIFSVSLSWIWGNKPSAKYMSGPEYRESVAFLKKQLQECARFIEGITGKPYDWSRLNEIMDYTKQAAELRLEAIKLCKSRPSPASFFEWTNSIAPVNFLPDGPRSPTTSARKRPRSSRVSMPASAPYRSRNIASGGTAS
jgi:hypothetical protein